MQGFLRRGASLQHKASLWHSSPFVVLQKIRLFSEARESALPIVPPSHCSHIATQDYGRNFCEQFKKAKTSCVFSRSCPRQCLIVTRC